MKIDEPRQFAFHENVAPQPPRLAMWERCKSETPLTREEKNDFFHSMMCNSGKYNYLLGGWRFPFKQFMKRYIVKYSYNPEEWLEVWAFDKTCIRYSHYTNSSIVEIKHLP